MSILFGGIFLFILISTPVGFAIAITTALFVLLEGSSSLAVTQRMVVGLNSFTLLAIPGFILAGELMNTGGITKRIFAFAHSIVGGIPGGLGHANVVASIIFSGMSGSAIADIGGIGAIEVKAMQEKGYSRRFSMGLTLASSLIGPIIPPSIVLVIYAMVAEVSVGRMFIAGIIPGILLGILLMVFVYYRAKTENLPTHPWPSISELWTAFRGALLPLLTPVIIIGGMMTGIVTPTEAAVLAVVYALVLGFIIYRELNLRHLHTILSNTLITTATTCFIVSVAAAYGWILTRQRIPHLAAEALLSFSDSPVVFLFLANLLLLVVGCFLDPGAAILILGPILVPIATLMGVDLVHFGVVMVFNLLIGLLTPPVGLGLFIGSRVAGVPIEELIAETFKYYGVFVVALALITFVPAIVLYLPNVVFGSP